MTKILCFICISLLMYTLSLHADTQYTLPPDGISVTFKHETDEVEFKGTLPTTETAAKLFIGTFCENGGEAAIYFKVGNQIFAVPKQKIAKGLLRGILKEINFSADNQGKVTRTIPRLWGCESHPVPYVMIDVEPGQDDSIKGIILSETPEGSRLVEYLKHLNKIGACITTANAGVIACNGSRTLENGDKVKIAFFIVLQDASNNNHAAMIAPSGIPVHARCEEYHDQTQCTVSDDIGNKVTAKTEISEKALNRETIEQLREKLVTYVNSIKTPKEP